VIVRGKARKDGQKRAALVEQNKGLQLREWGDGVEWNGCHQKIPLRPEGARPKGGLVSGRGHLGKGQYLVNGDMHGHDTIGPRDRRGK